MSKQNEINVETTNWGQFFIIFILIILVGVFSSLAIAVKFEIPLIGIIGSICFILPVFFQERISRFFKKNVKLIFYDEYFSMALSNIQDDTEISSDNFSYDNMISCIVSSTPNKYSYSRINITFLDSQSFKYAFRCLQQETPFNVSETIYKEIRSRKKDIILMPPFLASKKGTNFIIYIGLLILLLIISHICISAQTSPFTMFVSIALFINLLNRRKADMETYKRLTSNT